MSGLQPSKLRITPAQRRALTLLALGDLHRTVNAWRTVDGDVVELPAVAALRRKGLANYRGDPWHCRLTRAGRTIVEALENGGGIVEVRRRG